jgi:hypothetical protein
MNKNKGTLENKLSDFKRMFKGIHYIFISQARKKKKNIKKANKRKQQCFDKNMARIYKKCVVNPIDQELPHFLQYPPSIPVPTMYIDVETLGTLECREARCIASLINGDHFSNAAGSRLLSHLRKNVADKVFSYLYPSEDVPFDEEQEQEETSEPLLDSASSSDSDSDYGQEEDDGQEGDDGQEEEEQEDELLSIDVDNIDAEEGFNDSL